MDMKHVLFGFCLTVCQPMHAQTDWATVEQQLKTNRANWEEANQWNKRQSQELSNNVRRVQHEATWDVATVVSRQPRFATQWQQICTQVPVERRSPMGGVVGGVIGAVIGNQIGDGRGRDVATAAGAVIGHQLGSAQDTQVEIQTRCQQQPVQIPQGEIVTFDYRGRRFTQVFP